MNSKRQVSRAGLQRHPVGSYNFWRGYGCLLRRLGDLVRAGVAANPYPFRMMLNKDATSVTFFSGAVFVSFIRTITLESCEQAARFNTASSYGAAFIFPALMWYLFLFDEGAEQSPYSRNAARYGKLRRCLCDA
jgi:hypothetical protein